MGVDIVTEPQRPQRDGISKWARNSAIALGLSALVAVSYHSATGPSPRAAGQHNDHVASALVSVQRPSPVPAATQAAGPSGQAESPARPGPADPADPANRQQTSLQDAAGREHPVGGGNRPGTSGGVPPAPRGPVLPSEVFKRGAANLGGCLQEYGENGQCVPAVPPSLAQHFQDMGSAGANPNSMEHRWSCTELRKYFQDGVAVRQGGVDPQGLDRNGDGRACGAGD
jgi:hypothetical protein